MSIWWCDRGFGFRMAAMGCSVVLLVRLLCLVAIVRLGFCAGRAAWHVRIFILQGDLHWRIYLLQLATDIS